MTLSVEKTTSIILRSLKPNKPYHVQWLITRRCNYQCRGCNVWRGQDPRELSTTQIKKGLDILKQLGVVEIVLSGGNPLLRSDIGEIIEYASKQFIVTVYDNGSMALGKLNELKPADFVAISLDSLDPRKNDYVRGVEGAWQNSMKAIKGLHENGISVGVSPTISQFNVDELEKFTEFFISKEIPVWYCLYSYDMGDQNPVFQIGKKNDEFEIKDRTAVTRLCDFLLKTQKKDRNVFMTHEVIKAVRNLYEDGSRTWKCRALSNFFVVDHLGRVAGCHLHDPVTSVFELPEAWTSAKIDSLRERYSTCTQCNYMCYIFYSLHGSVLGNIRIAQEQWKNASHLIKKRRR